METHLQNKSKDSSGQQFPSHPTQIYWGKKKKKLKIKLEIFKCTAVRIPIDTWDVPQLNLQTTMRTTAHSNTAVQTVTTHSNTWGKYAVFSSAKRNPKVKIARQLPKPCMTSILSPKATQVVYLFFVFPPSPKMSIWSILIIHICVYMRPL